MKKLIGTAMLAALLATSAFAEGFTIGAGWLNSNYVIGSDDGDNVVSGFGMPWGMGGARWASFNIGGDSEHAGFLGEVQINNAASPVSIGQAFTYIKPIEQIQLIFGKTDQNYLRGDNCLTQWDYWRAGAFGMGEGHIFDEFEVEGVGILVTPMDALKIFAGYKVDLSGKTGNLHEQIGRTGSLGAAYTIGDIGTVKAGVWAQGKKKSNEKGDEEKDRVLVEAAFELTAIEGVFIGVGAKIPLGGTYNEIKHTYTAEDTATPFWANEPVQVNAGVALNLIENLGIQLNFGSKINAPQVKDPLADTKYDGQFGFAVALGVDYTFAESWKVFGSVGYANNVYNSMSSTWGWNKDDKKATSSWTTKDTLTFGVGVAKSWSNALLGIEFVGMTNDSSFLVNAHNDTAFNWAIPIKMNVSF